MKADRPRGSRIIPGLALVGTLFCIAVVLVAWTLRPEEAIERNPMSFEKSLQPAPTGPERIGEAVPGETQSPSPPGKASSGSGGSGSPGQVPGILLYKTRNVEMQIVPAHERPLPPGTRIAEPGEVDPPSDMNPPQ